MSRSVAAEAAAPRAAFKSPRDSAACWHCHVEAAWAKHSIELDSDRCCCEPPLLVSLVSKQAEGRTGDQVALNVEAVVERRHGWTGIAVLIQVI